MSSEDNQANGIGDEEEDEDEELDEETEDESEVANFSSISTSLLKL